MCGIIAICGQKRHTVPVLVDGLHRLEYRGYDSAGIGIVEEGSDKVTRVRAVGKVKNLETLTTKYNESKIVCGIAHTRWATHGSPTETNCHPHSNMAGDICVVHNGIVENYESLRQQLKERGFKFVTHTDTEVLAHLIDSMLTSHPDIDLGEAVRLSLSQIEGTFGLAVLSARFPGVLVGARRGSPLIVGVAEVSAPSQRLRCFQHCITVALVFCSTFEQGEYFLCSDAAAIIDYTQDVIYLADNQLVTLKAGEDVVRLR